MSVPGDALASPATNSDKERPASWKTQGDSALKSLELFAGPGGLALGVHRAGFQHLALIEREQFAVQTLRANSKGLLGIEPNRVIHDDARNVNYNQFSGLVDLLAAGPPCQPFSTGGRALGPVDERNMFPLLLEVIPVVLPRAILIENVKGLTRDRFQAYFDYIVTRLRFPMVALKHGESWQTHHERLKKVKDSDFADSEAFIVHAQVVNAADFGVPQFRERVLIHAFRRDQGIKAFHLTETHGRDALLRDQWVTQQYWERHQIEPLRPSKADESRVRQLIQSQGEAIRFGNQRPWRTVRDAISDLPSPVSRGQNPIIANHVQHPGARAYPGHTGSQMDMPSKALKAGAHGTPGGENMVQVPETNQVRYFTTREAARLQTFPDQWEFNGSWGACIQQLGNAVPVRLAHLFASAIHDRLLSSHESDTGPVQLQEYDTVAYG